MKKPATEAVTAAKNATADETAAATEGSRNLVPLRRSLLRSPLLSATLLSTPKKSPSHSLLLSRAREKGGEKIRFGFATWGPRDKNTVGERFSCKQVCLLRAHLWDSSVRLHGCWPVAWLGLVGCAVRTRGWLGSPLGLGDIYMAFGLAGVGHQIWFLWICSIHLRSFDIFSSWLQ
jgi:hypothetical protein